MAKKIDVVNESANAKKSEIDGVLVSRVLILWGLATGLQGVIIVYTMVMFLISNISAGLSALSFAALPYELNAISGTFNLFFGIALIALGQKAKNW